MNLDALGAAEKEARSRLDDSEVAALVAIRAELNGGDEVSGCQLNIPSDPGGGGTQQWQWRLDDGNFVW